jgi:redox-sensitive bicupin YhaK (pirin superfamily)
MLTVYRRDSLGHADHGWLDTRHHFSFASYHNPQRMQFGKLRVINDDLIAPGTGFGMHPHRDMEIITFVRRGAITHMDSRGNKGRTAAGHVQVMSAGTGIMHAEHNAERETTAIFQIWILPKEAGITPRWESARYAQREAVDALPLLVSGRAQDAGKGALYIHQDAAILGGQLKAGQTLQQTLVDQGYLLVSRGEVEVEGELLKEGDGVEISGVSVVVLKALVESEVILIDVPA